MKTKDQILLELLYEKTISRKLQAFQKFYKKWSLIYNIKTNQVKFETDLTPAQIKDINTPPSQKSIESAMFLAAQKGVPFDEEKYKAQVKANKLSSYLNRRLTSKEYLNLPPERQKQYILSKISDAYKLYKNVDKNHPEVMSRILGLISDTNPSELTQRYGKAGEQGNVKNAIEILKKDPTLMKGGKEAYDLWVFAVTELMQSMEQMNDKDNYLFDEN